MPGNCSDEWNRVGSYSANGAVGGYDGSSSHECGRIEHSASLYRNESFNNESRVEWAIAGRAWMYPGCDSSYGDDCWENNWSYISHGFNGDLNPDHIDHDPVRDKERSFDTELTVTSEANAAVTIDYEKPYIKRNVKQEGRNMETEYKYPERWGKPEARTQVVKLEQESIYRTDEPDDGDIIAGLSFSGEFMCSEKYMGSISGYWEKEDGEINGMDRP